MLWLFDNFLLNGILVDIVKFLSEEITGTYGLYVVAILPELKVSYLVVIRATKPAAVKYPLLTALLVVFLYCLDDTLARVLLEVTQDVANTSFRVSGFQQSCADGSPSAPMHRRQGPSASDNSVASPTQFAYKRDA